MSRAADSGGLVWQCDDRATGMLAESGKDGTYPG